MTGWMVAGGVALLLACLLLTRVGLSVRYHAAGLAVRVKIGVLRLTVFPPKKKAARGKHPADGKKKEAEPVKKKEDEDETGGKLEQFLLLLRVGTRAAGRLRRKIRIDKLNLDLCWAARDPATAALGFGYANAAIGTVLPLLERAFKVRERAIRTTVDFNETSPRIYAAAQVTMTVGQGLSLGLRLLTDYLRGKKKIKQKAVSS